MTGVTIVAAIAGTVVAVAAASAVVWRAFVKAVEQAVGSRFESLERRMTEQDEDIAEHNRAVLAHLARVEECLTRVHSQVFPNGGSSLRDRVDELYELVLTS